MIENFSKLKVDFANEMLVDKGRHEQKKKIDNYESLYNVLNISKLEFYEKLAKSIQVPFFNSKLDGWQIGLANVELVNVYRGLEVFPVKFSNGVFHIASTTIGKPQQLWAKETYGAENFIFYITTPNDIRWMIQETFGQDEIVYASERLEIEHPEFSAKTVFTKKQKTFFLALVGLVSLCIILKGLTWVSVALVIFVFSIYFFSYLCKTLLFSAAIKSETVDETLSNTVEALVDKELPIYSIIIPLYQEAGVIEQLLRSLSHLDYPKEKLDIKLILETDDHSTFNAIVEAKPSALYEIIKVPKSIVKSPKTKPRACNYALPYCRGELLVIFDAEDVPDPNQLKAAVAQFQRSSNETICLQSRLTFFNFNENFITRMFTLEYAVWFDFFLPGLHKFKAPIPLGGTSNHFKLDELKKIGGWDAYNVTEDADLGLRIFQTGLHVEMLNSRTLEEAPTTISAWIKQRSRWIKGHTITYFIHMRSPIKLLKKMGLVNFLIFQMFFGVTQATFLISPILIIVSLTNFLGLGANIFWMNSLTDASGFLLLFASATHIIFALGGTVRQKKWSLIIFTILQPVYWLLHSVAAIRAFYQIFFDPHRWEKTTHGNTLFIDDKYSEINSSEKEIVE